MLKHCLIVFGVSMVPLIELRGAIPYGIAFGFITYCLVKICRGKRGAMLFSYGCGFILNLILFFMNPANVSSGLFMALLLATGVFNGFCTALLYGMIGTSGLRILVDNHVDYSKNRNMILTSVIFVTGLSGVTLALGDVSLSGMTLAAIVGMIMSLVFYAFDKFHLSNDA